MKMVELLPLKVYPSELYVVVAHRIVTFNMPSGMYFVQ